MQDQQRGQLLRLLHDRAFLQGDIVLSSGQRSEFYIDGKMVELHPAGAFLIGEVLYQLIDALDVDAMGGLAVGAVPMVTSTIVSCYHHNKDIEGFFVRDVAKVHGTCKVIEGNLPTGARVVVVDDVVTSGKSAMKAVEAVEDAGAVVEKIIAIVDRDAGASDLFHQHGYDYQFIFSKDEVAADVQTA